MNIAMLTTVGERCGIAAYTSALIGGLRTLPDTSVKVVPITEGRQPTAHYIEQARLLNADDVDVIHIQHEHSFWGGVMPRSSAYWELRYLLKKPVVLTAHTTYALEDLLRVASERRPLKLLAKRLLLRNRAYKESIDTAPFVTAVTIVHTSAARHELIARGVKPEYVIVVPTGVPEPNAAPADASEFRARYRLESKRLAVIFGYIAPNKGYELTLRAMRSLPEDITLVIAGGARNPDMEPYVAGLRSFISSSGLSDRVVITGYLSDLEAAEVMAAADLVLTPHTQATGSYSVTLPLTHGKAVLASDMDCFREMCGRVDCMELFSSGNEVEYQDKLLALLQDPVRRSRLSTNALKYAKMTSWPRVAALTRSIYMSAIKVYSDGHHRH